MEKDVFFEALETIEDLQELARAVQNTKTEELKDEEKARFLQDVIKLRRTVIGTTKCTESERSRLVITAIKDGQAARALLSLQSRIENLTKRIQETEASLEDQDRRQKLEEANERLASAKKRLAAKKEIFANRDKALINFRTELSPSLKLGTLHSVSEFDDDDRVNKAFWRLPRALQFLYSQLRNAKRSFHLPIEISIVSKTKIRSLPETGSSEIAVSLHGKKPRSGEKKAKFGPGEKRRKRWYEAILGKESISYEDWMPHQRLRHINHLVSSHLKETELDHGRKYQLLMKLLDSTAKQYTTKKKPKPKKSRRRPHPVPLHDASFVTSAYSLPVPEDELCVELKFFESGVVVASLTFSYYSEEVFVASSPDWFFSRTIKSQAAPIPVSSSSITAHYGYPLDWAQDISGIDLIKDDIIEVSELKIINEAMLQKQEQVANSLMHIRNQAIDLKTFKSAVAHLRNRISEGVKKDSEKTRIVCFQQIPVEVIKNHRGTKKTEQHEKHHGLASGWWTVVVRKHSESASVPSELPSTSIDNCSTRIRLYPHYGNKQASQKAVIEKADYFYECQMSDKSRNIKLEASEKIKESSNDLPLYLTGPVKSTDLSQCEDNILKEDLISGRIVVQKKARILRKYHGSLPLDYKKKFFPFRLQSRRSQKCVNVVIPEGQDHLFRLYKIVVQCGHIQLSVLLQINLMKPLIPILIVEGVFACSEYTTRTSEDGGRDLKDRSGGADSKKSNDHVKIEREKILRQEGEALRVRGTYDEITEELENLPYEKSKTVQKHLPSFCCEEAKRWLTFKLSSVERMSPEDCVRRMEELLKEWCESYASGVRALNEFLETGGKGKKKDAPKKRPTKVSKDTRREKRSTTEGKTAVHDEELEQGEIPSVVVKRSTSKRRGRESETSRTRERQRSRSPTRNRPLEAVGEGRESVERTRRISSPRPNTGSASRATMRLGVMRMDTEMMGERRSSSAGRPRRAF